MTAPDSAEVHVRYRLTGASTEADLRAAVADVSDGERERMARFVVPRDRRDFAMAHALLRRTLSACHPLPPTAWTFEAAPGGKPRLTPDLTTTRLSFNLAHTDGLVACVVTRDADVGVDVEAVDRPTASMNLARRFFSPAETAALEALDEADRPRRFIELWTLKEAYLKAIGTGLARSLGECAFVFDEAGGFRFEPPAGTAPEAWQIELFAPRPRYRLAVAIASGSAGRARITLEDAGA